jgi:diguanylate cyclase (GGDEF)-like protein
MRFAAVSITLMALVGVLLAHVLSGMIQRRALESATDAAVLATVVGIQPLISDADLRSQIPTATTARLDKAVRSSSGAKQIARIKIWNRSSRVLYTLDPHTDAVLGPSTPSPELAEALEGKVEAEVISSSEESANAGLVKQYGTLLEVYVPIRHAGDAEPAGVFEIYLPYAPTAASIRADTLKAYGVLGLGLLVLWLGLFRTVATASRQLRRQSAHNAHQALHDALTGLPNRLLLHDRITQALRASDRDLRPMALLLMDLDRFKEVNDTLGHRHGDTLILQVGERLRATARAADTVARLGGDEFAVLLPDVDGEAGAMIAAERMLEALRAPFDVAGLQLGVEASFGVALYPSAAADADVLLQHADIAMYVAKRSHAGIALYDRADDHHSTERLQLLADLRTAIDEDQLVLHYQPKLDLRTGLVKGFEALVRWEHPTRGLLPPVDFVPMAERTGLIHPLTDVVLRSALKQVRTWCDGGNPMAVAVNVSTRSLLNLDFPDRVLALLTEYDVAPELLGLEITETTIMEDPQRALTVLTRLYEAGVRLSIDDFGTGYSSLAYLKRLPVHELKVDRSFVANMMTNDRDRVIVNSTVALGQSLGLDVVAEGVEDEATRLALETLGCDLAQGFLFSRPVVAPLSGAWSIVPV